MGVERCGAKVPCLRGETWGTQSVGGGVDLGHPPISISAGCHDAPPNGVEIPVKRFAISVNFIGVPFGTEEAGRPRDGLRCG